MKPVREQARAKNLRTPLSVEGYSPAIIDLEITAGYHQLGRFLSELENHSTLIAVEELDIRCSDEDPSEHEVELKIKTYVSSD
ncbi:MAG: type 4a pilus biogenesis protein PilO [Candidatus Omnitrophota bacterium]